MTWRDEDAVGRIEEGTAAEEAARVQRVLSLNVGLVGTLLDLEHAQADRQLEQDRVRADRQLDRGHARTGMRRDREHARAGKRPGREHVRVLDGPNAGREPGERPHPDRRRERADSN